MIVLYCIVLALLVESFKKPSLNSNINWLHILIHIHIVNQIRSQTSFKTALIRELDLR